MKRRFQMTALALFLAGSALAGCSSDPYYGANSDSDYGTGYVAFGYRDGYWDREHNWHRWDNHRQAAYYRTHNREHYDDRHHDHDRNDRDMGWRNERWWDSH